MILLFCCFLLLSFNPVKNNSNEYVVNVDDRIDLKNQTLILPENSFLSFNDSGCIVNGTIRGNSTKITGVRSHLFDNVQIEGSWMIDTIKTDIFKNSSEPNMLRNLLSFTSPTHHNVVIIEPGTYYVKVTERDMYPLRVDSNTTIINNGIIKALPNNLKGYGVIFINNAENVKITGNGYILGDKDEHLGNDGEWGMGIYINKSRNITIENVNVENCWGDCIYIGGESSSIRIQKCNLNNARRQGISITSANDILICDCSISNIYGTNPQYGIDIEPNTNNSVDMIKIIRTIISNCHGGILSYGKANNASIGKIEISNCRIDNCAADNTIYLIDLKEGVIERNIISSNKNTPINVENCEYLFVKHNNLNSDKLIKVRAKNCANKVIRNN